MSQPIRSEATPPTVAEQPVVQSEEVFSSSAPQADSIAPAQQNSSCFQMLLHAVSTVWICIKEKICCCFFPLSTAQVWQRSLAGLGREIEAFRTFIPTFPGELDPGAEYVPPVSIPHHISPYLGMTNQQAWDAAAPAYTGYIATAHENFSALLSRLNSIESSPVRSHEFNPVFSSLPEAADQLDAIIDSNSGARFDLQFPSFLERVSSIGNRSSIVMRLGVTLAKLSDEHVLDFPEWANPDAPFVSSEEDSPYRGRTNRQVWNDRLPFYKSIFSTGESLCRQYILRQGAADACFTSQEREQIVHSMPEYATLRNFLASSASLGFRFQYQTTRLNIEALFIVLNLGVGSLEVEEET